MLQCINTCCFCLSLRAGTFIIGYTFLVLCVVGTIVGRGAVLVKDIPADRLRPGEDQQIALASVRAHGIWVVVVSFIYLAFCVSLVISAHRYLRHWHIPWIIATIIIVVMTFSTSFDSLSTWLLAVPFNLFLLYCCMVVFSRYVEMAKEDSVLPEIFTMTCCCAALAELFNVICCQPRVASLIVGYIAAIDSLLIAIKCFLGYNHELITLITITKGAPPGDLEYKVLNSICTTRAFVNCVLFLLCVMMLYGIYHDFPSCMMPWLVCYLVVIMMDIVLILASCIWIGGIYILFYMIFIALRAFGLYIVFTYYLQLRSGYKTQENLPDDVEVEVQVVETAP